MAVRGAAGDEERPGTTLEPRWLESPVPASCALDESAVPLGNVEVGRRLGRHRTLIAAEVKRAVVRGIEAAEEIGVDRADFLRALLAGRST